MSRKLNGEIRRETRYIFAGNVSHCLLPQRQRIMPDFNTPKGAHLLDTRFTKAIAFGLHLTSE